MNRLILIGSFLLLSCFAYAQPNRDAEKTYLIEQRIEIIAEIAEDEDLDYTTLFDELSYFYEHPLNLNNATREDLERVHLLTDLQIEKLLEHIEKHGKLVAIYELQTVDGFDPKTINDILPFVKVSANIDTPHISMKELFRNSSNELFLRWTRVLEEQEGFSDITDSALAASPNSRYLGDANKLYMRYRFKFRQNVSVGFTTEKDAGEQFFKGSQPNGFDFYSAHLFLRDFGKLKQLAVGDYHIQFGQGLTAWSGLAFGKSSAINSLKRNPQGLRPYASVDENLFLRGAAATVEVGPFDVTAFYSQKNIDANISAPDTLTGETELVVTSFQTTGLHSTPNELEDRDAIGERHMGGRIAFQKRKLTVGVTGLSSRYDGQVERSLAIYNQFEFNSNQNTVIGADYNFILNNFNFFGEVSRSASGGVAYLNGALISLDPKISLSIFQRNYQRDFQNLLSNAVGEASRNANEQGLFFGVEAKPTRAWTISAYFDRFSFPWMRFRVDAPNTDGFEYLAQVNYRPSKKLSMYARIRHRERPQNTNEDVDDIDFVVSKFQTNYRYNITYTVSDELRLRNRVEFSDFKEGGDPTEKGFLIYQDVMYQKKGSPFQFKLRYALFESDSYDARIYAFENDVLYGYSIPAYAYRGSRFYIVTRYKIRRGIDLWVRYGQWVYNDRDVISSGLTEIQGNRKSEIKAQLRFKF